MRRRSPRSIKMDPFTRRFRNVNGEKYGNFTAVNSINTDRKQCITLFVNGPFLQRFCNVNYAKYLMNE